MNTAGAVLPPGAARSCRESQTISGIPWASSSERVAWNRENASGADVKGKEGDAEQRNSCASCTIEKNPGVRVVEGTAKQQQYLYASVEGQTEKTKNLLIVQWWRLQCGRITVSW